MNSSKAPLAQPVPAPRIIPRSEHPVSRAHISPNALKVLYKLRDAGFMSFLVGGCVRDLMLGEIEPKDFDVATDALPEQVKSLFRNCRLVGRRFRLAHVYFGREIIEVATFRAASAPSQAEEPLPDVDAEEGEPPDLDELDPVEDLTPEPPIRGERGGGGHRMLDETGRILRDNTYGTISEDVWRRDFTVNALYYNIADFSVWDYAAGAEDIAARRLRLIGDPETRFREDPVRMLRAARFEAKLGFTLDPEAAHAIARHGSLLAGVPPARLFDETVKLFLTGHGVRSLEVLRRRGLLGALLPTVEAYLDRYPGSEVEELLIQGLVNTDSRVQNDKPVTPTFLFALLLYGPIASHIEATPAERWHEAGTILDACDRAVRDAQAHLAIPRRFSLGVREMFALQPRLEYPRGKRALRVLESPKFRAAYDLLLLRADRGLASQDTARWWTRLQEVGPQERAEMVEQEMGDAPRMAASGGGGAGTSETAPRPRRRRRRRRPPSSRG